MVNLLAALRAADPRAVETFLINPDSELLANLDELGLAADGVIRYALPRRRTPRSFLDSLARRALAVDPTADRVLAGVGVRVAFGHGLSFRLRHVRTASWIPDVQHVHLPEHFSEDERERRSAAFRRCLAVSDRVVVTSATVRDDLARLAPAHAEKCVVLHPASAFPAAVYQAEPREVVTAYRLPEKFFYLPNHFWTHKNHAAVLEAVRILRDRGDRVVVVMTGIAADFRAPLHASEFFRKVAELGLREQLLYLGVVPRRHVALLMRQSIAVLNPSLFEGWGYSVAEAAALGKRVIISDIPIHREQDPPDATYVPPDDPSALASALASAWHRIQPGREPEREQRARADAARKLESYGASFTALMYEVAALGSR
ncbi:MAG: glycosyltransferase family 1 protein [Thermoanaerobaculaceae bacterium]|nr:glycosyltransferase family 1 protein [Thermoanaerobaculaceae bacterium]